MTKEQIILQSSLEACRQRTQKLRYSIDKNESLFPITPAQLTAFTSEQEESVDALILRYSQCVTMIQEQLFRGIAFLEQEDSSDKSNRDKTLLMEKLGAIQSAARLEKLNLVMEEARFVLKCFDEITAYLARKGFIA